MVPAGVLAVAAEGADLAGRVVEGWFVEAVVDEKKEPVLETIREGSEEVGKVGRTFGEVAFGEFSSAWRIGRTGGPSEGSLFGGDEDFVPAAV